MRCHRSEDAAHDGRRTGRLWTAAPLLPLIVASGFLSETVEHRLRHDINGPLEIFTKPINLAGMLRALKELLARHPER
jgi:hypothetical protein